jgi:hypothetical protein
MSVLLRPEDVIGGGTFQNYFGIVLGATVADHSNEVFFGKPGGPPLTQYVLEGRGGVTPQSSGAAVLLNETALLVLKVVFGAAGSSFSLFVDPDVNSLEPASPFDAFRSRDINSIGALTLYSTGAFGLDEIRIGTTYADVVPHTTVPEPSTLSIAAMALLGVAWAGRRPQRQRL